MKFSIVLAMDKKRGIGKDNKLPWRLPGELKYFADITTSAPLGKMNAVIMGRKTWESLPRYARPLKGRINVILSRTMGAESGGTRQRESEQPLSEVPVMEQTFFASSLEEALQKLEARGDVNNAFVIGGANLAAQALVSRDCEKLYLTEVLAEFDCDTFFPELPEGVYEQAEVSDEQEENGVKYRFTVWKRKGASANLL